MNVFEYIESMKNTSNNIVGIAGLGILALFLLVIVLKMLGGMRRGVWRQLVRTGVTFAAAAVSYFVAASLSNGIIGMLKIENLKDLIATVDSYLPGIGETAYRFLESIDPSNLQFVEYAILLPATIIVLPIIATLVFIVINLLFKIIRAIIIKVAGLKKASNNSERLGGALLAGVEGIIWMIMITLPFSAILSLTNSVYEKATAPDESPVYSRQQSEDEEENAFVDFYEEYIAPFTKNPASTFVRDMGANAVADGIATVNIDGKPTNMRGEVVSVAGVVVEATKLADADFTALNQTEKNAVTSIVFTLSESTFMSKVLVSTLNTIPQLVEQDIIPVDLGDASISGLVDSVMVFLEETSTETLDEDLTTLTDVYFGLCDSGIIAAATQGDDVMDAFKEGKDDLLNAINALSSNERTENIVDSMYDVVLNAAFSGGSSAPEEEGDAAEGGSNGGSNEEMPSITVKQIKENLLKIAKIDKANFADDAAYEAEVSETIIEIAKDIAKIEIEKEMADKAAAFVNEHRTDKMEERLQEVVDDKVEFNNLVFALIDAYQCYLDGEEIDAEIFKDFIGEDILDDLIPEE